MISRGHQKNSRSSRTGARRVNSCCCPSNARRRACPRGLDNLGCRRLKHGRCQHPSGAWWRQYRRFLPISRASYRRKSGGDFPTRISPAACGGASGTSATCPGFRRKPRRTSCRKAGVTEPSDQESRVPQGSRLLKFCQHMTPKRQAPAKPIQIGETG